MERNAGARLVVWTVGPGCLSGVAAAAAVAAPMSADDMGGPFWAVAAIASLYGAFVGSMAGFVIGLPVALVVGVVRQHTDHWRGLGAALAGAAATTTTAFAVGPDAVTASAVAVLAVGSAWWGLGHVFGPPPVPRRLRTPSAHRES